MSKSLHQSTEIYILGLKLKGLVTVKLQKDTLLLRLEIRSEVSDQKGNKDIETQWPRPVNISVESH